MKNIIAILASAIILSGCLKVGENYKKPEIDIENQWNALEEGSEDLISEDAEYENAESWWEQFQDGHLSLLIEDSLAYNHDLRVAEARIKEAVANERAAFAGLFPEIGLTGSFTRDKSSAQSGNIVDRSSRTGLNGSWDVDIFGSNRRRREAAEANVEASQAERDRIELAIIAEVARSYIRLRSVKKQRDIILSNITIQEETLDATKVRRQYGAISDLEVTRAEAQVESTKALLPRLNSEGKISINRLHVLTGVPVNDLKAISYGNYKIPYIDSEIIVSTPVNVISGRPDVAVAERNLAAATALTGAAIADMFPKLSLQGFFGAQESNIFGAGNPWSMAANGLFPLLNFGRLRSAVKAADARQEQALAEYQKAVLLAMEETENNFTKYINEQNRMSSLDLVLEKRKTVAEIAKEQYTAGAITQLDLLVAQENQLNAENELVLSETEVAQNIVSLYQSMGVEYVK